jgi:glycosyltransferase involved in cell wall biosynthesis
MKILMVITTLDTGGAEKHLLWLSRTLIERGHAIEVVYLKGDGSLAGSFREMGVPVEKVTMESPFHLLRAPRRLAALIRERGFDVVHSHLLKADFTAALARPEVLVASKHNDERALLNPLFGFVHGWISRRARCVVVLSDHVGRFVQRHGRVAEEKITRIYYGLDAGAFSTTEAEKSRVREELGLEPKVPVLTMVARFAPQKDHAALLEAARGLKQEGRAFRLLLVGGDPFGRCREEAEALSRRLDLDDRVTFTGIRSDVPALLGVTDLFVMPSLWEGLGLVFLEAMAFALPVVASRVSAVPEVVAHEETGLLTPPGDPEALRAALARLLDDPDAAARMGRAGRRRLEERFSLETMCRETEKVYFRCLGRSDV